MQHAKTATPVATVHTAARTSTKKSLLERTLGEKNAPMWDHLLPHTVDGATQEGVHLNAALATSAGLVNPGEFEALTYPERKVVTAYLQFYWAARACGSKGRGKRHHLDLGNTAGPGAGDNTWFYAWTKLDTLAKCLDLVGNNCQVQKSSTHLELFVNSCTLSIQM